MVSNEHTISSDLKTTVHLFSIAGLIPFVYFAVCSWFPSLSIFEASSVFLFKVYAAIILSFLAGALWASGLFSQVLINSCKSKVQLRSRSLLWSGIMLSLLAWGNLFISDKAGLFVGAMLFLAVWQIEQKTELTKCYPNWYTALRAKLSMTVGALHILIWLTIS